MPIETRNPFGISDYSDVSGDFATLSGSVKDYPSLSGNVWDYPVLSGNTHTYPTLSGDFHTHKNNVNAHIDNLTDIPNRNLTDLTGGTYKLFFSTGDGMIEELSIGDSGLYLMSQGVNKTPSWAEASGGGGGSDNLGDHEATQMLDMNTYKITGLGDPVNNQDATTKTWVNSNYAPSGEFADLSGNVWDYLVLSGNVHDYPSLSGSIWDYPIVSGDFASHLHNGDTIQCDGINSDGGNFSFSLDGDLIFQPNNQSDTLTLSFEASYSLLTNVFVLKPSEEDNGICIDAGLGAENMIELKATDIWLNGDTFVEGVLSCSDNRITSVADPEASDDAVTRNYLDSNYYPSSELYHTGESYNTGEIDDKFVPQELLEFQSASQDWEGIATTGTIDDASTSFGDVMYIASDGHWERADADGVATMPCMGMALTGGAVTGLILLQGKVRNDDWNWTMAGGTGQHLYVSGEAGSISQTAPNGDGDLIQIVGYATSGNEIRFNPDNTYIEYTGA